MPSTPRPVNLSANRGGNATRRSARRASTRAKHMALDRGDEAEAHGFDFGQFGHGDG